MKICCVCGARPNFMKIAAVTRAMQHHPQLTRTIVHTGQHYDERMCKAMFDDLALPRPDFDLEVGSGSHAAQTAEIMKRFEPIALEHRPDLVVVVGDVNSTIACALVASKLGIAVAHVESGLRSFDRDMPEEINRLLTDAISDLMFVSEPSGMENLAKEGVPADRTFFVGNVMIDTLLHHRERAMQSGVLDMLGLAAKGYGVLTLHRPSNVDDPAVLSKLLDGVDHALKFMQIVFPVHPRTRIRFREFGLDDRLKNMIGLKLIEPAGYLDFLRLVADARLVLTDSGGIQEETTILNVPCLTLRENTERPATIDSGLNRLVGSDPAKIRAGIDDVLAGRISLKRVPEKWDGRAGERIVNIILQQGAMGFPRR
ncbi:MAG TPA: UDP-N-acetylglucosamine 2-epimerase (non-hydrolyzing) [Phycisphaerales bacterium]|nr:UDP-N-acetylglucosamine 2-epimerase (non-hydrolyzing) [Phycisphaerales bacterium]HRQ75539.1 UDP-N-acetylglucosamine 2-epimerase (non-hydrolyzing) [Phycisphaerales bacterium]